MPRKSQLEVADIESADAKPAKLSWHTRPSAHLIIMCAGVAALVIGLVAIMWSGGLRGYFTSRLIAGRNVAFLCLIVGFLFWLVRRQRFRGDLMVLTAAFLMFAFGMLMQYRLFSDPEYGAHGEHRTESRRAKGEAVRLLNVETGYDEQKRIFLFGPQGKPVVRPDEGHQDDYSIRDLLTSANTYVPVIALLAMALCFRLFRSDRFLNWMQQHWLMIGVFTLLPFSAMALASEDGKFLGQTTPWEAVKVLFLLSFAGLLTDTYRHLRRTRWGLPPLRYFVPFAVVAAMPVLPFFALSDFGQMLVFFGAYMLLYFIAVRKKAQLAYAIALSVLVFGAFYAATKIGSGAGIPRRVYFRFYQWAHTWEAPTPDTWWWKRDFDRYLQAKHLTADTDNPFEVRQRNAEAWADKVLQQSQGLFGVNEGGVIGTGLGLGFPETVPVSDSDFIYTAVAEETGLMGSAAVLIALSVMVIEGIAISLRCQDMFTKLLAAGTTAFLGLQALVNIGGVLRLLPMTGITLPFVSHGGWSLITSFTMLGVLLAVSDRNARVSMSHFAAERDRAITAKSHI
ncbi:MAG TPA: FtsW/RodA/SpoVE family cell cycle protein [Blastocatellia bacterium]|nr:FtsW/RodA/SpoVE family cell cycle protein [Blastocatellia bacterium]